MPDVNTMTVEQCIEFVAEHVCWPKKADGPPEPGPTIDYAARFMRELCPGVMWQIGTTPDGRLSAHAYERYEGAILRLLHDQDEECELRWRLLVACLMAQKKEKA